MYMYHACLNNRANVLPFGGLRRVLSWLVIDPLKQKSIFHRPGFRYLRGKRENLNMMYVHDKRYQIIVDDKDRARTCVLE